ncbi:hypothetical protein KBD75_02010 [Candidatus Woesebacteria bacterium]|nr:hypothetical protein [Candidatus Woesebacteria bacterium]
MNASDKLDGKSMSIPTPGDDLAKMVTLSGEYIVGKMDLAEAYLFDGATKLENKVFGKILLPLNIELKFSEKSQLRNHEFQIKSDVWAFFVKHDMENFISKGNHTPQIDSIARKTDEDLDHNLASEVRRHQIQEIPSVSPELYQRWVYGTAILTMYDQLLKRKKNLQEYSLKIKKLMFDGVKTARNSNIPPNILVLAQKVGEVTDRSQLLELLNQYLDTAKPNSKSIAD